jgi:putative (di)nucleoside polyphosphate hydrolase
VPLDVVVEFKRGVYEMALTELSRFVPRVDARFEPRADHRNRYLRGGMRQRDPADAGAGDLASRPAGPHGTSFELPPGATFEPDPQAGLSATSRNDKHDI